MQVSQVNDHITHAVIGGGQSIEFGISNSAEFFNILSSTLYKDQILAVVREVLCNANDAHIEAGVQDTPVEITLSQDKFVIRDFGKGIHRDDIGPIYGTYGNSTKKNDGTQTGGFGLGCKAPFAYTDHFEVISMHDGVKTIYNMSKSSGQTMGKPSIVPIASFPTTETGLQVTIKIKPTDYYRFTELIHRIIRNGDMNMKVNGSLVHKLGFDSTKSNYMVTNDGTILQQRSRIMVRYGNVIYPVDATGIKNAPAILEHLNSLDSYDIVFQAPPHSIAVTPSRESLSMQDHTINTLNKLFEGYIRLLNTKFNVICSGFAENSVKEAVKEKNISELLSKSESLPGTQPASSDDFNKLFDMASIARKYMSLRYPAGLDFRKKDIKLRLEEMAKAGLIKRGLAQTFIKDMDNVDSKSHWTSRNKSTWFQRRLVKPLLTKLMASGLDHKRLYTYDSNIHDAPSSYSGKMPIVPAIKAKPHHLFTTLPYLRNIVVISASQKDVWNRAKRHKVFEELGHSDGFFFYHAPLKQTEKDKSIQFFKDQGMQVVDLTVRQEWEEEPVVMPKVVREKKPPKKGITALSCVAHPDMHKVMLGNAQDEDAVRIENPEFVVLVSFNKDTSQYLLPNWDQKTSAIIVKLWGDKGGITNSPVTVHKWKEKGAKVFADYVNTKVVEYIKNSATIKEYWAFKPQRLHEKVHYDLQPMINVLYENNATAALFNIKNNLTDEDKLYLSLWEFMTNSAGRRYDHQRTPEVNALMVELDKIPLDPANDDVIKKFQNNKLLKLIDVRHFNNIMMDAASSEAKKALEVLVLVLN